MSLLSQWLKKKGIESPQELTKEERIVYDSYKAVLSGETLTVESIKQFCQKQVKIIEDLFAQEKGKSDNDVYYKACLHVYLNILRAIEAPERERETLEKHLNQLINSD